MIVKNNVTIAFRTPSTPGNFDTIEQVTFNPAVTVENTATWSDNVFGTLNGQWEIYVIASGDDIEVEDPFARIQFKIGDTEEVVEVLWQGEPNGTILAHGLAPQPHPVYSKFYTVRKYYTVSISGDLDKIASYTIGGRTSNFVFAENTPISFIGEAKTYRVFNSLKVNGQERLTNSEPRVDVYLWNISQNTNIVASVGFAIEDVVRIKFLSPLVINKGVAMEVTNYSGKNIWIDLRPGPATVVSKPAMALSRNTTQTVHVTVCSTYDILTLEYDGGPMILGLNPTPDAEFEFGSGSESKMSLMRFPALPPPEFNDLVIDDPMRFGKVFIAPGVRRIYRKDIPIKKI